MQERLRRGFSQQYIIGGQATRKPVDFKLFLENEENKKLSSVSYSYASEGDKAATSRLEKCETAVAVVEGKAYLLATSDGNVSI